MVKKRQTRGLYLSPKCCRRVSDRLMQSLGHLPQAATAQAKRRGKRQAQQVTLQRRVPQPGYRAWTPWPCRSSKLKWTKPCTTRSQVSSAVSRRSVRLETTRSFQSVCGSLNKPYYAGKTAKPRGQSLREDVSLRPNPLIFLK